MEKDEQGTRSAARASEIEKKAGGGIMVFRAGAHDE